MVDMNKLHPKLRKLTNELLTACERKGIPIRITQGYRSKAEQDALYAQGRTKPGNKVTNARGGYSMHNWGVAIDYCRNDGKAPFDDSDGFFTKVGKVGMSLGLEWGGQWRSIKDKPHFQLPDWGSTTENLRAKYGTYEKFAKTWGGSSNTATKGTKKTTASSKRAEDVSMTTIKKGSTGKAVKVWQVIIGTKADGTFGDNTVTKTKAFQKKHGLTQDGIVGNNTWRKGLESI